MSRKPGEKSARFGEKGMRIARSWETLLLLAESTGSHTAQDINRQIHRDYPFCDHQCSVQTTREDLKTLQKCGFPVCMVDDHGSEIVFDESGSVQGKLKNVHWQLRDPSKLGTLKNSYHRLPTANDVVALSLCRALLDNVVPVQYPLHSTVSKMLGGLQIQLNEMLRNGESAMGELQGRVRVLGRQHVGEVCSTGLLNIITSAISRKQVLTGLYENLKGCRKQVDLAPLAVWFADGRAYTLAAGATDKKIRTWRIDRFSEISVEPDKEAPEISERIIEETLNNSFKGYISEPEQICLQVMPDAAYLFREYLYHPSQKIMEHSDYSLTVTLQCPLSWGLEEWILGFGELVIVKEPERLRNRLIERVQGIWENYH